MNKTIYGSVMYSTDVVGVVDDIFLHQRSVYKSCYRNEPGKNPFQ